jgi:hypothetical protein
MTATGKQIRECAESIAAQAQAIADGTITGPLWTQARKILFNAELLAAWVPDDRSAEHTHEQDGQKLTHAHVGGKLPHGYFGHAEDGQRVPEATS